MRVLFFAGSLKTGGAERTLSRLANFLVQSGYEVHLVLRTSLVDFPLEAKVHLHILPRPKGGGVLRKAWKTRKNLREIIQRLEPHVVCSFTGLTGVMLAATFTKNTVVRFGTYPLNLKKWKQALYYTFFHLPRVRRIVCQTEVMYEDVGAVLPDSKLRVIHNPAVKTRMRSKKTPERLPDRPFIVSMGRLTRGKAYDVALRAYKASAAYHQFDYVFLGDGRMLPGLKRLAQELGIADRVHFLGYQSSPYPIIERAAFFVHTSRREGFPNVLLEALSLNKPVIATDCKTGPSEIVIEGTNGYLVPVDDEEKLAEKISTLANDPALLQQMSANARGSTQRFSEEVIFRQWASVLGLGPVALPSASSATPELVAE